MSFSVVILLFVVSFFSYLLGSISFAVIFTKIFVKKDIRTLGSGNAGSTNVWRSVNALPAVLTFAGDFLKMAVAVIVSRLFVNVCGLNVFTCFGSLNKVVTLVSGLFVVFGHIYPCFFNFRGGKAIVCLLAFTLLLDFRVSLLGLSVFVLVLTFFKMVSLASILGAVSLPVFNLIVNIVSSECVNYSLLSTFFLLVIAAVVVYKHAGNIKRIRNHTESKLY